MGQSYKIDLYTVECIDAICSLKDTKKMNKESSLRKGSIRADDFFYSPDSMFSIHPLYRIPGEPQLISSHTGG